MSAFGAEAFVDYLLAARPDWSQKEIAAAVSKLAKVGIETKEDLEKALAEGLNEKLRLAGQKTFNADTVRAMRACLGVKLQRRPCKKSVDSGAMSAKSAAEVSGSQDAAFSGNTFEFGGHVRVPTRTCEKELDQELEGCDPEQDRTGTLSEVDQIFARLDQEEQEQKAREQEQKAREHVQELQRQKLGNKYQKARANEHKQDPKPLQPQLFSEKHVMVQHAEVSSSPKSPRVETHDFDFDQLPDADEWLPPKPQEWDGHEWEQQQDSDEEQPTPASEHDDGISQDTHSSRDAGPGTSNHNPESLSSSLAADQWMSARSVQLCEELQDLPNLKLADRRRRLRALQLELHPDKQPPGRRMHAQQLFLMVQCEWEALSDASASSTAQAENRKTPWEDFKKRRQDEEERQRHAANTAQPQKGGEEKEQHHGRDEEERQRRAAGFRQRQEAWKDKAKEEDEQDDEEEAEEEKININGPWDDQLFQEAEREFRRHERTHFEKVRRARREYQQLPDHEKIPVILRIHSPLHPSYINNQHLWEIKTDRSQIVLDIKEILEEYSGVKIDIMRLTVHHKFAGQGDWTDEGNLEDLQSLGNLPAGPFVDLCLRALHEPYVNYIFTLKAVLRNWRMMQWAPSVMLGDRTLIRVAMWQNWTALRQASEELRSDRRLLMAAIKEDCMALELAPASLRANRRVVSMALKQSVRVLKFASPALCANKELILQAVKQDVDALEYAAPELYDDRQLMLTAIRKSPNTLSYASSRLRADRELVRIAVLADKRALVYAAPKIRREMDALLEEKADDQQFSSWDAWDGAKGGVLPSFQEYQKRMASGLPITSGWHKEAWS